jgi:hypothetical protein
MPRQSLRNTVPNVLGITSFKGINIPWLHYQISGVTGDHYGDAWTDSKFNGSGAQANMQYQLGLLQTAGIKYARLWLNMFDFMTTDATLGYTGFQTDFLANVQTYCQFALNAGIKLLITFDDGWFTFPWTWVSNTTKAASYVQACKDVVTALYPYASVWAFDYQNEPYMGWSGNTTKQFNNTPTNVGCTRQQYTTFLGNIYAACKPIAPTILYSVASAPSDNASFGVGAIEDFYQVHWYGSSIGAFPYTYSQFDKPCIVSEYGFSGGAGTNVSRPDFLRNLLELMLSRGFPLCMLWSTDQLLQDNGSNTYGQQVWLTSIMPSYSES